MSEDVPSKVHPTENRLALLEQAFDTVPIGLLIARERIIAIYNDAFSRMFGYAREELVGQSMDRLYPSIAEFQNLGERAIPIMKNQGKYSDERIMRHRSGRLFWCHVTGKSLNAEMPLASATWAFEDISESRPVTSGLTARERQIARLLVEGKSSKEIARALECSPRTIEAHRARLMRKLNVKTASALVAILIGGANS